MFEVKEQYAMGGDAQLYIIDKIPAGANRLVKPEEKIIARGETSGHCHILTGDVEMFEFNGQMFAVVGNDGAFHQHYKEANVKPETFKVNKNISDCDHTKECRIEAGVYAIGIDRQYDPHDSIWKKNKD